MILIFVVREDVGILSAHLNVHVIQDLKSGWMENAKVCRSGNGPRSHMTTLSYEIAQYFVTAIH